MLKKLRGEKSSAPKPTIQKKSDLALTAPKCIIRALYPYVSQNKDELSFNKNDFFYVNEEPIPDWYLAANPLTGSKGLVPKSYFEVIRRQDSEAIPVSHALKTRSQHSATSSIASDNLSHRVTNSRSSAGSAKSAPLYIYGFMLYDFTAERNDELTVEAGESIVITAQSNEEWFVAKPICRLGGPGLVPISYVELREVGTDRPLMDVADTIKRAGVPQVDEWKRKLAEYKASSIALGKNSTARPTAQAPQVAPSQLHHRSQRTSQMSRSSQVGIQPGIQPGIQSGARTSQVGSHGGSHGGSQVGAQVGAQGGSQVGSQVGSHMGSHMGSQKGSIPGSVTGSVAGPASASAPGSRASQVGSGSSGSFGSQSQFDYTHRNSQHVNTSASPNLADSTSHLSLHDQPLHDHSSHDRSNTTLGSSTSLPSTQPDVPIPSHMSKTNLSTSSTSSKQEEPFVVNATVDRFAIDGGRYWYLIKAEMSNGKFRNLCRYYQDFYDFQVTLLEKFPEEAGRTGKARTLPFMPGPLTLVTDSASSQRRANLDDYVHDLIKMPPHVSRSVYILQLFQVREGDIESDSPTERLPEPMEGLDNNPMATKYSGDLPQETVDSLEYLNYAEGNIDPAMDESVQEVKIKVYYQQVVVAMKVPINIRIEDVLAKISARLNANIMKLYANPERTDLIDSQATFSQHLLRPKIALYVA